MGEAGLQEVQKLLRRKISIAYIYGQRLPNKMANSGAVLNLCKALVSSESSVTLAYLGEAEEEEEIRAVYELPPSVECIALPPKGSGLFYPSMAVLALRHSQADVVITRMPQVAVLTALLGRPTILELHQHLDTFTKWRWWSKLLRLASSGKLAIATLTDPIAEGLDSYDPVWRAKATAVETIPSAALDLSADGTLPVHDVGYVGSFMPGKGIEKVLLMAQALPAVSFVVYGDPKTGAEAATSLAKMPNVTLGGFVPNRDIAAALATFRIGVAPYASTGFGKLGEPLKRIDSLSSLKVIEYMSASKAILSSRIPPIEECVEDRRSALLCDPDDDDQWISAVAELANDAVLRQTLAANAREAYLRRFTYSVRAQRFLSLASRLTDKAFQSRRARAVPPSESHDPA